MTKKTKKDLTRHYVRGTFRLDDDVLGRMQVEMIDEQRPVAEVAEAYGVSAVTAYRVRASVPAELCHVDEHAVVRYRRRVARGRATRARRLAL